MTDHINIVEVFENNNPEILEYLVSYADDGKLSIETVADILLTFNGLKMPKVSWVDIVRAVADKLDDNEIYNELKGNMTLIATLAAFEFSITEGRIKHDELIFARHQHAILLKIFNNKMKLNSVAI
jgi:hypothetical protein